MKTNLSNIVKLVNPNGAKGGGKGESGEESTDKGIETKTLEKPEELGGGTGGEEEEEGEEGQKGEGSGKGKGKPGKEKGMGSGEGSSEGDGPMVDTDDINNIDSNKTTVVRNDVRTGKSQGKVVGRGTGEVISPAEGSRIAKSEGYDERSPRTEEEWKKDARTSAQTNLTKRTKKSGSGEGAIYQRIMELTDPIVDWRAELRRFIGKLASSSDFKFPARRSIGSGDYRYGIKSKNNALENGVVAIDVSGSIASAFPELLAEVVGIASAKKIKEISVLPWNDRVVTPVIFKNFKKPTPVDFEKVSTGGGSNGMPDVMRWIQNNVKDRPEFVVIITDGYIPTLPTAPKWGRKTIWLIFDNSSFDVPAGWGQVIHAKGDDRYK